MTDFAAIIHSLSFGTVPQWGTVLILAVILWKGLPGVLDAWTNRISKEREHTEREFARLERQIVAGDERHDECLKGQAVLRAEVDRLNTVISGLIIQMRQLQLSGEHLGGTDGVHESPTIQAMLKALERMPTDKL